MFGGGKRKVKVFSSVFNLAGDIRNRPNFLKTVIYDQTLFKSHPSYSSALSTAYRGGIGIKMRQMVPLAKKLDFYNLIGQSGATVATDGSVTNEEVKDILSFRLQKDISIYNHEIGGPDLNQWGLRYILDTFPERADEVYDVVVSETTDYLQLDFYEDEDALEPYESFEIPVLETEISNDSEYLYISYGEVGEPELIEEIDEPSKQVAEFPSVAGYGDPIDIGNLDTEFTWDKTTTVTDIYPDREDKQVFKYPQSETRITETKTYQKIENIPISETHPLPTRITETLYLTNGFTLVPYATETVTEEDGFTRITVTENYTVEPAKFSAYNKTEYEIVRVNNQKLHIYEKGTGDPLFDELFTEAKFHGMFFPVIPIKYDSRPGRKPRPTYIDEGSTGFFKEVYDANVQLTAKMGSKKSYKEILEGIQDNKDHGKLNYAYIMYGASLNTPAESAHKYMFHFFKEFSREARLSDFGGLQWTKYLLEYAESHQSRERWAAWYEAQKDENNPLFGTAEPPIESYPLAPKTSASFRLRSPLNLNYTVSWKHASLKSGSGMLEGFNVGQAKFTSVTRWEDILEIFPHLEGTKIGERWENRTTAAKDLTIAIQHSPDRWEEITIVGLYSNNIIHRGKGIYTTSKDALQDSEESNLIIPLHESILKQMSLVDTTQFGLSSSYMLINYYNEYKKKWYQTGTFKVFFAITIIAVSAITGGAGLAAAGTIGSVVATTIGLAGLAAVIFAAVTNALVGIIVTRLVSTAATKIFGEKIGMIVGAIVSVAALNAMNSFAAGGQFNLMDSFNATNLIKITSSVSQDMTQIYASEIEDIQKKMQEAQDEFDRESKKLNELYYQEFGGRGIIDPLKFQELAKESELMLETPDLFFSRTLMTGSDIADISIESLTESLNLGQNLQVM